MADVKWIKIVTDIFDDEKILMIESMPDSDTIIVIWFKLLCLAGKQNNGGVIMLTDRIPYNEEMLSKVFRRPLNTVRLALQLFEEYGMIEIIENAITIPNWNKHQSLDSLESKRERDRLRQAQKRSEKKALIEKSKYDDLSADSRRTIVGQSLDSRQTVAGQSPDVHPIEGEREGEKEIDTSTNVEVGGEIPPDPTFISLILNNKTYFEVPASKVEKWKELYPAVDVEQELRKMCDWCESNPSKRKTRTGILACISRWLAGEQNKGGSQPRRYSKDDSKDDDTYHSFDIKEFEEFALYGPSNRKEDT